MYGYCPDRSHRICLTFVHSSLHSAAHVLDDLAEEVPEQACQEGAPQVQALVGVVIPVILIPPAQRYLRSPPPFTERQLLWLNHAPHMIGCYHLAFCRKVLV